MIREEFSAQRDLKEEIISADLVVVGGGLAGVCCSLTAARAGVKVVLVQDRPVLGGNSSSEVRLWILGATSHMGNNNRWAREGGAIDEILVENMYRNKEGNPVIFDTILLEKVSVEPNIILLLNTSVYDVEKKSTQEISQVTGFCSQNSTRYLLRAHLFCDASGDGIVAFQSGASFRIGAESPEEFGELFAPDIEDYGELLGHSIYFYSKDIGKPVKFVAPSYALKDIDKLPRMKSYQLQDNGCRLWWVEYGGRLDTVHQSEEIKWELWSVIYGIWDYVKNSGNFPEAEALTLEWVGTIPGKRESRRFIGDYILNQQDIVEQRTHFDAVAMGGWSLDLHPADGVYSDKRPCNQWHSKGVYQIPYRCYYSKDLDNLFLVGRIISVSHVAFGSTRVMATNAHGAQAVGMAAALAVQNKWTPRDIASSDKIEILQQELNKYGQGIPLVSYNDSSNLVHSAHIIADGELVLAEIPSDGPWILLEYSSAQLLPLKSNTVYRFHILVKATENTNLVVELRRSSKIQNYTPDVILESHDFELAAGEQSIDIHFSQGLETDQYAFLCFMANPNISIRGSETRITGILSVFNRFNKAVSNYGKQVPPPDIGIDSFEFWTPTRRPGGHNFAMQIEPPLDCFKVENLKNGMVRPEVRPNAYIAPLTANESTINIHWTERKRVREIILFLDTDYDHPMESALMGHPENVMPFCIRNYEVRNCETTILCKTENNYQTINRIVLEDPIETDHLQLKLKQEAVNIPIALFEVMCFS